ARLPEDWQTWADFEADADELFNYEPLIIPGLSQTAEYAGAISHATGPHLSDALVNTLIGSRIARQACSANIPAIRLGATRVDHRLAGGVRCHTTGVFGDLLRSRYDRSRHEINC